MQNEEKENDPIKLKRSIKKELAKYRKQFEKDWREYDDAYYGKQHKTGEGEKRVKNHIFKTIEAEVPVLTDSMPATQIDAEILEKQQDAEILNKSVKYVYQDQNFSLLLPTLVRDSLISAPAFLYPVWNPDAQNGDGSIEFHQLDWKNVFLDGNAKTLDLSESCHIEIPMRKKTLASKWPEKYAEIMDLKASNEADSVDDDAQFESRDSSQGSDAKGKPSKYYSDDIINYCETWVKSYDLESIPEDETLEDIEKEKQALLNGTSPNIIKWEDHPAHKQAHMQLRGELLTQLQLPPDAPIEMIEQMFSQLAEQSPEAQEQFAQILFQVKLIDNHIEEHEEMSKLNPKGQKPKYKDGWRLIKSISDVVLYDGPNPEEHGMIQLVPFYAYKDSTIYGFGEVKNIIDAQRSLNWMDNCEYDNLKVNSNSGWIADHESEVDADDLTNEPGLVVKKAMGTEVRRLESGMVSPQLSARKQADEYAIGQISGVNEATQGTTLAGANSGVAIQKLQTQAIGRIRLKDRYLNQYSIRRLGLIVASLIIKHWTAERRFRLRSDNTSLEEVIYNPIQMQDLEYSINVSEGSMAGIDKDALNQLYIQYYQLSQGQMTFEDLLLVSDFPKKDLLLSKIKERNEQAIQSEEMNAQVEEIQAQLQKAEQEKLALKGLINKNLLQSEEKKMFEAMSKQALLNETLNQEMPADQGQG